MPETPHLTQDKPNTSNTRINNQPPPEEETDPDPIYEWYNKNLPKQLKKNIYDASFDAPFLVIMESNKPNKNLGRLDPIAIGKLVAKFIQGERTIHVSGRNQIKIFCDSIEDANLLLTSPQIPTMDFSTFIPDSLFYGKGTINVLNIHPVNDIIDNIDPQTRTTLISAIRKRQRGSDIPLDYIELRFNTTKIPKTLYIYRVAHHVFPVIPTPKRCHYCQLFGHVMNQCRANTPTCEYCGDFHITEECNNQSPLDYCFNCSGQHKTSSNLCPVYKYECLVMKERYLNKISKSEAVHNLNKRGIYMQKPNEVLRRNSNSSNRSSEHPMSPHNTSRSTVKKTKTQPIQMIKKTYK